METSCRRMSGRRISRVITIVLVGLVLLTCLDRASGVPYKRSLLRLCSTSLSDALKLLCQSRGGYNEAFSYNEDNSSQDSYASGTGLADECCYHTCTMTQLMEYCKPEPPTTAKSDTAAAAAITTVKDSSRILNLAFPATNTDEDDTSSKERSRSRSRSRLRGTGAEELQAGSANGDIEHERDLLKCKNQRSSRVRKHRINNAREDDDGEKSASDLSGGGQPHFRRKSTYPPRRMRPPAKTLGRRLIAKSAPAHQRRGHEPPPCSRRSARPLRAKRKGIVVRKATESSMN